MPGAHVFTWNTPSNNLRWRGIPHGDPRLARMGVKYSPYDRTFVIDDETEELVPRMWEASDVEAAETGIVLGEESIGGIAMTPEAFWWLARGMLVLEVFYMVTAAAVAANIAGSLEDKYASKYTTRKDWSNRDTSDKPIRKKPWWGIFDPTTDDDWANPDDSSDKDKSQPAAGISSPRGNFAGLVTTFLNPQTSRIIGYKGIRPKRRMRTLEKYSQFWYDQSILGKRPRLTQDSVLVAPSQA